jgi:nucleoside-diphosphate-sugar epimerase
MNTIESLLITGSNGFVGQSFLKYLRSVPEIAFPKKIILVNRTKITQMDPEIEKKCEVVFLYSDLTDQWNFDLKASHVLNLAGDGTINAYSKKSGQNFVKICNNLSEWALINNPQTIVHASSGACFYDVSKDKNYLDKANLIESRLKGESILNKLKLTLRTNIIIARLFTFIGPNMLKKHQYVAPIFIRDALENKLIKVTGNPDTVRSYMHEATMSKWLFKCLLAGGPKGVISIGSSVPVTIRELAEFIAIKTNSKISFENLNAEANVYLPSVKNELNCLDISDGPNWQECIEECIYLYSKSGKYFA